MRLNPSAYLRPFIITHRSKLYRATFFRFIEQVAKCELLFANPAGDDANVGNVGETEKTCLISNSIFDLALRCREYCITRVPILIEHQQHRFG